MRFALAALLAAAAVGSANATVIATASFNGHTYDLLSSNTWTGSEAEAVSLGVHLVTVNDAAENTFLYNTFGGGTPANGSRGLWIGYNDAATEGSFLWVSGLMPGYTNWDPGEPNNAGDEDYAYIRPFSSGRWNDVSNASEFDGAKFGVVELAATPEPVSLVVFGGLLVGGAGVALRRRMATVTA